MLQVKDYKVKWIHETDKDILGTKYFKAITYCMLLKEGEQIDVGVAGCSLNDNFSKDIGRKLSLKRAIEKLPKKDRTVIWESYRHGMTEKPRW